MKKLTVVDLRHYERNKDAEQSPTRFGFVSTVATAFTLEDHECTPQYVVTSPQARAVRTAGIIIQLLKLRVPTQILPELDDLSSDPRFDMARLKSEAEEGGISLEEHALRANWSRPHLFMRSTKAFEALGALLHKHLSDGMTVLIVSHGASLEMRCLRMMNAQQGGLLDETLGGINLDNLRGGCFATSEGVIYHDVIVANNGQIERCGQIEFLRTRDEVKVLKPLFLG